jgi:hypothetical protein
MGAKIQLLDLPGIIEGAKDGKGRGRQVIATARTCSLILIVLDVMKPMTHKAVIEKELEGFGIRLNKKPPNIVFRKKEKVGLTTGPLCASFTSPGVYEACAILPRFFSRGALRAPGRCAVSPSTRVLMR